ncbi:hypothetical protein L1049_000381 [Liquidambar formosana]|uniref:Major facilitator superfamily (MFS) profile domain-containing protein n=1 Tax=Liquidambar formosana TaxID=63359 RepID=A0AAP0NCN3_LIQFO
MLRKGKGKWKMENGNGKEGGVSYALSFLTMNGFVETALMETPPGMPHRWQMGYHVSAHKVLTLTSSLYIAGWAASLVASCLTVALGRRNIMVLGGRTFLAGATINGGAANVAMLILGRILLGFGVGFTNQATPIYLSEMAPPKWRGAFNSGFQFFIGIGVVTTNCINYGIAKLTYGWRLSLGLAIVPAVIMTLGALLISDTPSSLVPRPNVATIPHHPRPP